MKRFQFSISGLFALTFLVAIVLSLRGGFGSARSFETIWIAVFPLSYWKSPKAGWRQVVRAAATTAVIWGVLMLCLYAWFLNRKGAPSAVELALHAAVVVLAAVILTAAAAWGVEGIRAAVRFWLRRGRVPRALFALAAVGAIALVAVAWMNLRPSYWEPVAVTSADEAFEEGFPWLPQGPQSPGDGYFGLVVGSEDGRLAAATLDMRQKVQVFDLASEEIVASFAMPGDERFGDLTFHPDSGALAALVYSETAGVKLLQWDIPDWTPREPIPLDHLLDHGLPHESRYVSLDRCLLVMRDRLVDSRRGNLEIFTADLTEDRLVPRPFAAAKIEEDKLRAHWGCLKLANPRGWMVSPSGKWVCGAGDYLFSAGAAPIRLRGSAIGFFRDVDCLAVYEQSVRFSWKCETHPLVAPPFWDYLHVGHRYRVTLYDCRRQRVTARSRWFTRLYDARLTPDRSRFLAEQGNLVLIWELPGVARE